jgi:hypothetical protein
VKFAKPSCRAPRAVNARQGAPQPLPTGGKAVFCMEGGSEFLDGLFTFSAFLLVFAIGLGFGLFVR